MPSRRPTWVLVIVLVALTSSRVANAAISASGNLNFGAVHAGTTPATQPVSITSDGLAVAVNIVEACPDVTVTPASGTVPASGGGSLSLTVSYTASATTRGSMPTCTVTVDGPGSNDTSFTVDGESTASNMAVASTLAFGNVRWNGTASATATVVITNTGNEAISSANLTTAFATGIHFTLGGRTGFPIAPGGMGGVDVKYDPLGGGMHSDTLTLTLNNDLATDPATGVTVTGTGVQSLLTFSPGSPISIGSASVGGTVDAILTLQNLAANGATAPLNIMSMTITGTHASEFSVQNHGCTAQTCSPPTNNSPQIATNATDGYLIRCAPAGLGTRTATLTVVSDDVTSGLTTTSKTVTLNCTGFAAPSLGVSPAAPISFGNQRVGTQSGVQNLTISNGAGASTLSYTISSGSSEFPLSCAVAGCLSGSVAAGASATVEVRFAPAATGARTTNLLIVTNDPDPADMMRTYAVNGTGTISTLGATAPMSFGNVDIATVGGATQNLSLTNTGSASLNVSRLQITGDPAGNFQFAFASCPVAQDCNPPSPAISIAPTANATITLRCDPSTTGPKSATLVITSDDPASPRNVTLGCNGTTPDAVVAPTTLADFGSQPVGTTSATTRSFTLTNPASGTTAPLSYSVTETSPSFSITCSAPGCTGTLAPGGTAVTVTVSFQPSVSGPITGVITVSSNDLAEPTIQVAVSGTGAEGLLVVSAAPVAVAGTTIDFGPRRVMTSTMTTVTLTNQGNVPVTVSTVGLASMTEGFSVTGFTNNTIVGANGGTTTFMVVFAPTLETQGATTLTITSDWNDPTINLVGDGQVASVAVTPDPVSLGNVPWDGSATQPMTITNNGTATVNIISATVTSGASELTVSGFTAGILTSGGSRTFDVNAIPTDAMLGLRNGMVRIATDLPPGAGQFIDVPVSYTSVGPAISLTPGMVIDFGAVNVDAGPATLQLQLANTGTGRMDITSVGTLTGPFSRTNFADLTIDPAQTETLTITYDPTTERAASNPEIQTFTIATSGLYASGTQQPPDLQITVRGYGVNRHLQAPDVTVAPTYRNPTDAQIPTTTCGATMNQPCAVQVCNTGGELLDVSMIDDPDDAFDLASTGPLMVAPGSTTSPTCIAVPVQFRPPGYGAFTGIVTITSNDTAAPIAQVMLSGPGIARPVGVMPSAIEATLEQGTAVRLADLVPGGLVLVNMSSVETFTANVSAAPNATGVTATLVGDGTLSAGQTRGLDVELVGTELGHVDVILNVYLDGDPAEHASVTIALDIVPADDSGGGCCDTRGSGGAADGGAALLLLALITRRRRRASIR